MLIDIIYGSWFGKKKKKKKHNIHGFVINFPR